METTKAGSPAMILVTVCIAQFMAPFMLTSVGVASGMIGAMRTLGMAVSLTTISLVFSLFMGTHEIARETQPAFLFSMKTGLVVYAGFSCLGVILSFSRGEKAET